LEPFKHCSIRTLEGLDDWVPIATGQAVKGDCPASKQLPSADCDLIKDLLDGLVGIQGS
jgi:hypothetical protein